MISIDSKYNIIMTRGDTFSRTLTLTKDGETYTPDEDDVIRFAMAKVYKSEDDYELLISKVIDNDTLLWQIDADDTADLDYGRYYYDLQITYSDGTVETFANQKTITLTKEVV